MIRKIFLIDDSLANKISYYHMLLFLVSLPFDLFYSEIILISLAIHTLLNVKKDQLKIFQDKNLYILQSVYLLALISLLYTKDIHQGTFELTKELAILVFPLIFAFTRLDIAKYRSQLLMAFALTSTLTVVYLYIDAFRVIHYFHLPLSLLFSDDFLNHQFTKPIELHATYFSMYVGLSLIFLLYSFVNEILLYKKILLLICIFILVAGLIQLASRAAFIATAISIIMFPFFILQKKSRAKYFFSVTIIFFVAITLIVKNDILRPRYFSDFKNDLSASASNEGRMVRWKAAWELVEQKPFIGYGTGSEKNILKEKYFEKKLYKSYEFELNAHNQYLKFLLQSGLIGLIIYVYTLCFGFINVLRNKDVVFLSFLVLIAIVSFSENILDVNKGVFFYGFFFSFFIFAHKKYRCL
jgi:O-antigen ligase